MGNLKLELLAAAKKIEAMIVPELDGLTVYLRRMTGAERDIYLEACAKAAETKCYKGLRQLLLSLTLCDISGAKAFDDVKEIDQLDGLAIERLSDKAAELNGLTEKSRAEIEKKAQTGPTPSGSVLPAN